MGRLVYGVNQPTQWAALSAHPWRGTEPVGYRWHPLPWEHYYQETQGSRWRGNPRDSLATGSHGNSSKLINNSPFPLQKKKKRKQLLVCGCVNPRGGLSRRRMRTRMAPCRPPPPTPRICHFNPWYKITARGEGGQTPSAEQHHAIGVRHAGEGKVKRFLHWGGDQTVLGWAESRHFSLLLHPRRSPLPLPWPREFSPSCFLLPKFAHRKYWYIQSETKTPALSPLPLDFLHAKWAAMGRDTPVVYRDTSVTGWDTPALGRDTPMMGRDTPAHTASREITRRGAVETQQHRSDWKETGRRCKH